MTLLAHAAATRFAQQGSRAIVNIASVLGLVPQFANTVYGATKAFVIFLSQGLAVELGPRGVKVQAVLPAATRTELWEGAGADLSSIPLLMEAADLVDAALAGFDAHEAVTIPALSHAGLWDAFDAARQAMLHDFANIRPAARYLR